jgi:hypothetical protein
MWRDEGGAIPVQRPDTFYRNERVRLCVLGMVPTGFFSKPPKSEGCMATEKDQGNQSRSIEGVINRPFCFFGDLAPFALEPWLAVPQPTGQSNLSQQYATPLCQTRTDPWLRR